MTDYYSWSIPKLEAEEQKVIREIKDTEEKQKQWDSQGFNERLCVCIPAHKLMHIQLALGSKRWYCDKCIMAGIEYINGEPPQNTRARLEEAQKLKQQYLDHLREPESEHDPDAYR